MHVNTKNSRPARQVHTDSWLHAGYIAMSRLVQLILSVWLGWFDLLGGGFSFDSFAYIFRTSSSFKTLKMT